MNMSRDLSDDEDFLELVNIVMHPRQPKVYRERTNEFNKMWSDEEFRNRFRLSKPVVEYVRDEIADEISSESNRNHALSASEMVLLPLRFLACGCFLQTTGDMMGVDKSTATRTINKVTRDIARLAINIIKMPSTAEEIDETKHQFYNISKFPRCVGAIDCTHIKIQSPGGNDAENYRNRKGFFFYQHPSASHDANIFRNSNIHNKFENGEFGNALLLGDSGYGVKSYMMTPLANPQTPAEHLYNEAQIRTRNVIERCFGVWKRRFPILSLGIRLSVEKVEAIVVACASSQYSVFNERCRTGQ
ncbi:DDE superfamily endonuclease [Popillia japonica]|uniref:DDE superfamily endonuclease n=1 Tax=Popillia japonica TaxID=7064 RepID=A0AAW1HYE2_POPJA